MTDPFRYSGAVMGPRGSSKGRLLEDYHSPRSCGYGSPPRPKQIQAYISNPEPPIDPIAHIRSAIEVSREILDLEEDWDGNGSIAYDKATWHAATSFLLRQAQNAWFAALMMPSPDVAPGPNGSIDIVWQETSFQLLLNVLPGGNQISYWGRNKAIEVKGKIADLSADHKELFLWLMRTS